MTEEQWFAAAIDACAEPIIITDAVLDFPGPKIVYVNKAFERVTGYTIDELVGKTPRILQGEKTDSDVLKRSDKIFEMEKNSLVRQPTTEKTARSI